jgi:aminopeptidase N
MAELAVESYDITLDLDDSDCFRSRTVVRFSSDQPAAVADLAARSVESITLNGRRLAAAEVWDGTRLTLTGLDAVNVLEVDGLFPYAVEERGLRRAHDPDGTTYLYALNFPAAAPRVFCCFDDPGLRAKVTLTLSVPDGWTCVTNGTTRPLAPYVVAGAAGPWVRLHEAARSSVYAQRSRAGERGGEIAGVMAQAIAWYEDRLGVPYPYEKLDAVFVRDLPPLAFSAPGLILFNDKVFDRIAARGPQYAATVISHEVAHAWIGGLVDCDAQWLVEACATYLSRTAVVDLMPGSQPWTVESAPDAAYAPDAERIRDLEQTIGRTNILRGLGEFCRRFAHGNAGPAELAACWSELGGPERSHLVVRALRL